MILYQISRVALLLLLLGLAEIQLMPVPRVAISPYSNSPSHGAEIIQFLNR